MTSTRSGNGAQSTRLILAVLEPIFNFVLGPPSPPGAPGEGPDKHFFWEIGGFGPISARIRGVMHFRFCPEAQLGNVCRCSMQTSSEQPPILGAPGIPSGGPRKTPKATGLRLARVGNGIDPRRLHCSVNYFRFLGFFFWLS